MEDIKKKYNYFNLLKGVLVGVCVSLISILLFAFVLKFVDMTDLIIKIINQAIKIVSILLGVFFCLKRENKYGLLKGAIIGILYTIVSFLVFSILNSSFSFSIGLIFDLILSAVIGAICGAIFINSKNNV